MVNSLLCCQLTFHFSENPGEGCETIFECCGQDLNSPGCHEVCKKCNAKWGTSAGQCFQKPHDLERVEADV